MAILEEQQLKNITDAGIRQKVEAGSIEPYEVADAIDAAYEAIAFAGQPLDHALAAFSAGEAAAALALQMGEAALIIGQEAPRVADGAAAVETMAAGKVDKAPGARLIGTGELSSLQARLAAAEAAANPALQLLFHEDFEGDPADVWPGLSKQYVNNLPHSFQQLANPYGAGGAGRFELRQTDAMQSNGMRTEVLWPQPASADNDRWYAFRYYLPSQEEIGGVMTDTWANDNKQDILTQWHQGSSNPPVSLRAINSELRVNVRHDGDSSPGTNYSLEAGGYTKDAWVHLIFHIRWALDGTGLIEIWRDGVKLHTITGPNNFSGYPLPRWKLGIYKSDWNNGATTNVTLRVAYFDDVRMAGPEATFQALMQGLVLTPLAIPDKDAITYPDPPMLLTNGDIVNGQIVITDKRISSEDAKVSCINLMNVTLPFTLVMRNVITRQNGIHVRGHYSRFSFDIENCFGFDWENGPGSGRVDDLSANSIWGNWYLRVNDPYYGRLRHCYVEGSGLYKIEYSKANEASCKGVLIECNYSRNVRQPNALMNWGNLKGAGGATIPGILIRWNYVWNTLGEHWVEDTWNTYTLKGAAHSPIILEHNFFDGAAKDPAATEYTGGGAIVDGKGAITRATIAENIRIRYNQFIRQRNYMAACACGYGVYIYGNRGVVSGLNPDGTPVPSWTSGFWSGDYSSSKTQSGNIRIYQNTVGARNGSSGRLDFAAYNEEQVNHTEIYGNTSLPEPLTVALEDAEYDIWEAKLTTHKITLGPVTPMAPVPQP